MKILTLINCIISSSEKYPEIIEKPSSGIYTCINAYKYHIVRKHLDTFARMDGIFIDGIFMCWLIKLLWRKKIKRLSFDMTSMAKDVFRLAEEEKKSIYLIGDEDSKISEAVKTIKFAYPKLEIVGWHSGFFKNIEDRNNEINKIIYLSPNYTIVGMGGLIQEQFEIDLKENGYTGIVFTCGGFFHQILGKMDYYPNWVNKFNLRMPYRLIKEKNYKRLWHVLFTFPIYFTIDTFSTKISKNKHL